MSVKKLLKNSPFLLILSVIWFIFIGNVIASILLLLGDGNNQFGNNVSIGIIGSLIIMVPALLFVVRSLILEFSYLKTVKRVHRKSHFMLFITGGLWMLFLLLWGIGLPLLWWANGSFASD